MNMKKIAALILGFSLTPITSYAQTDGADWTPLFKSWENKCSSNPQLDKLMSSMIPTPNPNEIDVSHNTKFKMKTLNLPAKYQSAVFKNPRLKINHQAEYYEVILSTNGYYYGMPLLNIRFAASIGGGGLHQQAITVDMPADKVRNILSKKANIRYETIDAEHYPVAESEDDAYVQIGIEIHKDDENPNHTHIICDYST